MNVLIADDSKDIQNWIKINILNVRNVTKVFQAFDVLSATEILQKKNIDIVISDIRTPMGFDKIKLSVNIKHGGNGFDLLHYTKSNYQNITVIMITNYPYPQYKKKSEELGADFFLNKNTDLEKLSMIIEKISFETNN